MSDLGRDTHEPITGIRTWTTQDGQTRYQARVNCRRTHKQYTQRFTNLAEAIQWRQKAVTVQ